MSVIACYQQLRLPPDSFGIMSNGASALELRDFNQFVDRTVLVNMTDGETAKVKVDFVDVEYDDIIVDVLETSRPERYREKMAAYAFAAKDIVCARLAE